jgi:CRP-like cAMP-binding protein
MAPDPISTIFKNRILRALRSEDLDLLAPHLTPIKLATRDEFEIPNKSIKAAIFPDSGIISVVARGSHKKQLEVGIIGREGMTGLAIVMGSDRSPHSTYVQVPGEGQRIASDDLRGAIRESPSLRDTMLRFAHSFMIQATHTALSNGSAKLEERLGRWLLMAHDRIDGDELPLVHEFLALMLGVRRPGVTVAIHSLESAGLIDGARGVIKVIDRKGLEEIANASYGVPEAEYKRLMGGGRGFAKQAN